MFWELDFISHCAPLVFLELAFTSHCAPLVFWECGFTSDCAPLGIWEFGFTLLRGQPSPTHMLHYEAYADMWHSLKHYANTSPFYVLGVGFHNAA